MKLGIVGLPNVGKSTLFNAITSAGAESANYPFCTIEPNVGVVSVPDERLEILAEINNSEKIINTSIEFYDIAGLVEGASKGEGLGNKFLSHIREVASIIHVVRCFEDENVVHVAGGIDPIRDVEIINLELILADLEIISKRRDKLAKTVKGDKTLQPEYDLTEKIVNCLEKGNPARSLEYDEKESELIRIFGLLSSKPVLYAANVDEDGINKENIHIEKLKEFAAKENSEVITLCAKIEAEISELEEEEKTIFLEELGLMESGLDKLIKSSYRLLGLISFLTSGPKETRAWTIKKGTSAPEAAGKIHSDIQRGFIRAETVNFDVLRETGSMAKAKEMGLVKSEGKDYIVKDGDVILFRFNV